MDSKNEEPSKRPGIGGHRDVKRDWGRLYITWIYAHYIMGTLAIMLTALAASKFLGHYNSYWQDLLLFISAIMTALLTFWRPGEKADRYRAAWVLLGNQIDRYDAHEVNAEAVRRV